ncbi:MAG: hypothetical protein PF569_02220 [Candidatus Woesearchaeota archaeon]|jgi:hypothetical protein|nr:hypothetical protein [Candidatus Woesearchaeota archaeon]
MNQREWILDKFNKGGWTKQEVRTAYDQFVEETNSSSTKETFNRRVRQIYAELFDEDDPINTDKKEDNSKVKLEKDINKEKGTMNLTSVSHHIKTIEDLLSYAEVDTVNYKIKRFMVNSWITNTKQGDEIIPMNNYQVKAQLEEIDKGELSHEDRLEIIKKSILEFKSKNTYISKPEGKLDQNSYMASFYPTDHHLGLLAFKDETKDADWNLEIAREVFLESIYHLYEDIKPYSIEKFVFVIGGDALNVDGSHNGTHHGTPQDQSSLYKKCFKFGIDMYIEAIEFLASKFTNIEILHIPGNHDTYSSYYLCEILNARFNAIEHITFNIDDSVRKAVEYGNSIILYHHGDEESGSRKRGQLPLLLAYEYREKIADKKYMEIHAGHLHRESELAYDSLAEDVVCKTRVIPSLSPLSKWGANKGYGSILEGQLYLYSKDKGNKAIFKYNPDLK